jgi:hypothetical protein
MENDCDLPEDLEYTENFLKLQPMPALATGGGKLQPTFPVMPANNVTTNYAFTRGWHCSKCGRLSSRFGLFTLTIVASLTLHRFKWEQWECSGCGVCIFSLNNILRTNFAS